MSDAASQMHAYYAARAPYYDAVYLKPERQADIAFLSAHLPERLRGRAVIEVACGTGYWTRHLAPACARMVATDGTDEPLAFARLRPGTGQVDFHKADAYALPADLGHFDGAFAGLWFSHVPIERRLAFLNGLHARLRPGARVLFLDNAEIQCREFPIVETDAHGNTYQQRTLRDGSVHRVLKNFPPASVLHALIAPMADRFEHRVLDNFWLLEYEWRGPCAHPVEAAPRRT